MTSNNSSGHGPENAEKTLVLASALFPWEEWELREPNIWVAKSRLRKSMREQAKLAWEIEQIQVLIDRDSAVYFLPEQKNSENLGGLSADTVINGEIVEIKSVSGTRATLGHEFKKGYRQGAYLTKQHPEIHSHSVFIRLFSNLSIGSVKAKIAGELKNRPGHGTFFCYFEVSATLFSWTYEELRGIIGSGQKNHPATPA
jgi:hypothetical protein